MSALGPDLPKFGPTGSPVVTAKLSMESIQHYLPPSRPERFEDVYDEDGDWIDQREVPEAVYAARLKNWEARTAEWERTGGMYVVRGTKTFTVDVICADGSTARAMATEDGQKWRWVQCTAPNATEEQWRAATERMLER